MASNTEESKGGSPLKKASGKPLEFSREEILSQIFGNVGDLMDDFSCAVESTVLLHGRLYVTDRFVCFYSNLFGLEKKIRIPFSHVTVVTKENTAMVIPNAISISTFKKQYIFRSFWDRDHCFFMLKSCISKHCNKSANLSMTVGVQGGALGSPSGGRDNDAIYIVANNQLNKAIAMPTSGTGVDGGISSGGDLPAAATPFRLGPGAKPRSRSEESTTLSTNKNVPIITRNNAQDQQAVIEILNGNEDDDSRDGDKDDEVDDQNFTSTAHASAGGRLAQHIVLDSSNSLNTMGQGSSSDNNKPLTSPVFSHFLSEDDFPAAANGAKYEVAIPPTEIPISVGDFYCHFLADDAKHSYAQYHTDIGDSEVVATPWAAADTHTPTREIKFFKPVNLPGLKSTRGVKLQSVKRYGTAGLILRSSTRLEDVPAADTFSVEDVVIVRRIGRAASSSAVSNHSDRCSIEIYFEVKFHKSTFIRWVISSNTTTEMTKWLTTFQEHLSKCASLHVKDRAVKLDSIKSVLTEDRMATQDDEEQAADENGTAGAPGLLPQKLSKGIKVAATTVQSTVTDSIESWQRVEGRRFLVLCFAIIFITLAIVYIQVRRQGRQMQAALSEIQSLQGKLDTLLTLHQQNKCGLPARM